MSRKFRDSQKKETKESCVQHKLCAFLSRNKLNRRNKVNIQSFQIQNFDTQIAVYKAKIHCFALTNLTLIYLQLMSNQMFYMQTFSSKFLNKNQVNYKLGKWIQTEEETGKFCMRKLSLNAEIKGKYSKIPEGFTNRITKTLFIL